MNAGMASIMPSAHKLGVKVVEAGRGFAAASVPLEGNANHFGVVYAGAQFTAAEILGGLIAVATFDAAKYFPLVKQVDIEFVGLATTDLRAHAAIDDDTIARVEAEVVANGKADYTVEAVVSDADGQVVATTRGLYQLRSHRV